MPVPFIGARARPAPNAAPHRRKRCQSVRIGEKVLVSCFIIAMTRRMALPPAAVERSGATSGLGNGLELAAAQRAEEAVAPAGMAGDAGLVDQQQQRVAVAIDAAAPSGAAPGPRSRPCATALARARPVADAAGRQRLRAPPSRFIQASISTSPVSCCWAIAGTSPSASNLIAASSAAFRRYRRLRRSRSFKGHASGSVAASHVVGIIYTHPEGRARMRGHEGRRQPAQNLRRSTAIAWRLSACRPTTSLPHDTDTAAGYVSAADRGWPA